MEIGDAEDLHFRGNLSLDLNCLSKAFYFILYIIVLIKLEGRDTNCLCLIQQVCSKTYSVCPDRLGQSIGEFEIANLVTLTNNCRWSFGGKVDAKTTSFVSWQITSN